MCNKISLLHVPFSVADENYGADVVIVANDTTGGILIRHKRGLTYCCVTSKRNCTGNFFC